MLKSLSNTESVLPTIYVYIYIFSPLPNICSAVKVGLAKKLFEWWESLERILWRVLEVLKKQRPAVLIKDNKIKSSQ